MTTTMTTVDNILKEVYEKKLRDQLQSTIITIMRVERTSEGVTQDAVGGKYTTWPVRVSRNHGMGARGEMEPLPTPRTQGYRAARVNLKYLYGPVLMTGQTFELASTNPQAFASAIDLELNGMREGLKKDTNRQVYGTTAGILATATANGTVTTFITTNKQYLEIDMFVDIYNGAGVLQDANVRITDISAPPGPFTITLDPAVTATLTGWTMSRNGNRGKEKTGFADIVIGPNGDGTGALFNITHPTWTGNVDTTAGALTEARMIAMVHRIRERGGEPTVGFCSMGVQRAYFALLSSIRQIVNTIEFAGGYKGLAFTVDGKDIPIVADYDCQPSRLYFMAENELKLYQAGDWGFMNRDGSRWYRFTDANGRYDAYGADYYKYCELGTHRRNAHGVLTAITEV